MFVKYHLYQYFLDGSYIYLPLSIGNICFREISSIFSIAQFPQTRFQGITSNKKTYFKK